MKKQPKRTNKADTIYHGSKEDVAVALTLQGQGKQEIVSDPLGSYTGTPIDGSRPVQDADDL